MAGELLYRERLFGCHPRILDCAYYVAHNHSLRVLVSEGSRSDERQHANFLKGRDPNTLRIVDKSKVVTYADAGQSAHNPDNNGVVWGADLAPTYDGKSFAPDGDRAWDEYGELVRRFNAEVPGLEVNWGGNFESIFDGPHIEVAHWQDMRAAPKVAARDYVSLPPDGNKRGVVLIGGAVALATVLGVFLFL